MKVSRFLFAAVSAGLTIGLGACATVSPTQNSFSFDPPVQKPKNSAHNYFTLARITQTQLENITPKVVHFDSITSGTL